MSDGGKGNFASKRAQRGTRFPLPSGSKFAEGNDDILNNFGCASAIRASSMAFDLHKLCFINAASRYHSPPVKQRAVHKHDKGRGATQGRFPPLPMKKAPERLAIPRPMTKLKNPLRCDRNKTHQGL